MNKLIFNLLAAVIITVSFAPVAFAESGDQELIQQYDELVDKWVSDGFNGAAIAVQTRIWLYKHNLVNTIMTKPDEDLTKHPELQNYIQQKVKQIPQSLLVRDMSDSQLIKQYDEMFDIQKKAGEETNNNGYLLLLSLSGLKNKEAHAELLKHIEQKQKLN